MLCVDDGMYVGLDVGLLGDFVCCVGGVVVVEVGGIEVEKFYE